MRIPIRPLLLLSAAMALSSPLVTAAAPAGASQSVGPHQHFVGLVNGATSGATVKVACGGPGSGQTGPVVSGQSMSVRRQAGATGYTGLFTSIYAWFVPASAGGRPRSLTFKRYGTAEAIPTSVRVPCSGSGRVEFSSCPYNAPCAAGWGPDYVTVRYVNVAVRPTHATHDGLSDHCLHLGLITVCIPD